MIPNIYISGDDLKRLYQKKKKNILWAAIIGAVFSLSYFIFSPPSYQATATFKQSSSRADSAFDMKKFVHTIAGTHSEISTIPLMLCRAVLTKTVEEMGLQAVIQQQGRLARMLAACRDNLFAELGRQPEESSEEQEIFQFQNVHYSEEKPRSFFLRFSSSDSFEVLDNKQKLLTMGHLNKPVQAQGTTWTLARVPQGLKIGRLYPLTILPRRAILGSVKARTTIKPLREDKNILAINFSDTDRERAALFVNTLISKYEEFLKEENKSVIGAQLYYLDQRQHELNTKLDSDIQDHVAVLKNSLLKQGFMGIEQEMESIMAPLQTYRSRLSEIEVEMAGLMQRLSQTDLPLPVIPPKLVQQFGQSLEEQIQDASFLLQKLEKNEALTVLASSALAPLVSEVELARSLHAQDYEEKKHQLASHLQTFIEHLSLRQKNLQESSTYIDKLELDFNGMTLDAARNLFQQYCRQLDDLHAQLKQVIFFRDHLNEPHFEISTLSNVLNDTVTQQLVQKSSELSGQLCDVINRSGREHERLKEGLAIQKRFLESHLSQTLELGKIRIQLIKEKISSLYDVMKDLLQKEKAVLENKIEELKIAMQELPELWHLDKRLKFKAELTKGMMEGLTHIAESKNLSRHLYQVESKPLDSALPPFSPQSPRLLIKCFGGAIGFASLFYLFSLIWALARGLPVSLTTLRLLGAHTSGTFSETSDLSLNQLPDQDLETLRVMASFLLERKNEKAVLSLLGQRGSNFCYNLAHLLAFHHQKILIIDCNFDRIVAPQEQPGLWQYLNHTVTELPIRHEKNYDFLTAGGTTRHGVELLGSPAFTKILSECKSRYDFVFLLRQTSLSSQDATQILQLSDLAIITTDEESQDTLYPYLQWSRQKQNLCATFAQHIVMPE